MKRKTIVVFACMLMLVATVLPVTGIIKNSDSISLDVTMLPTGIKNEYNSIGSKSYDCNSKTSNDSFEVSPRRMINIFFMFLDVHNNLNQTQYNVSWFVLVSDIHGFWHHWWSGIIRSIEDFKLIFVPLWGGMEFGPCNIEITVGDTTVRYSGFRFFPTLTFLKLLPISF